MTAGTVLHFVFRCIIRSPMTTFYLSIAIPLHSMGQIIKSVCVCLGMCVCICGHAYGRIFHPIFTKFGKDLWGLNRKNWLGWSRNPKMPCPILTPKTPKFTTEIGNSQSNIKSKLTWEWKPWNQWLKTWSRTNNHEYRQPLSHFWSVPSSSQAINHISPSQETHPGQRPAIQLSPNI